MSVTAIIVTYNSALIIEEALESVVHESSVKQSVVVDNASFDNTADVISNKFPGVELIKNEENLGFGCANNLALEKVKTEFALLLNPDASLLEGCLSELLEAAERYPQAAIIAPMLVDDNGNVQESYKRNVFEREKKRDKYFNCDGDICAQFLVGAVWLVRMDAFRKIGFFDPEIFLFYEDDDLCMRVKKEGYELILAPAAKARHYHGASSETPNNTGLMKQRNLVWSRLYLEKKYHGMWRAKKLACKLLFKYWFKALGYGMIMRNAKMFRHLMRCSAAWRFLRGAKLDKF